MHLIETFSTRYCILEACGFLDARTVVINGIMRNIIIRNFTASFVQFDVRIPFYPSLYTNIIYDSTCYSLYYFNNAKFCQWKTKVTSIFALIPPKYKTEYIKKYLNSIQSEYYHPRVSLDKNLESSWRAETKMLRRLLQNSAV